MSFKETDIRPQDLMNQKKPALEHDKLFLKSRIAEFLDSDCVTCGSSNCKLWAEKEGFTYKKCEDCGTIFMSPRPTAALLGEFYRQSENYAFWNKFIFPATDNVRKEKIFKPRAAETIRICKKYGISSGVLLEIGAAFGTYCEAVHDLNFFERIIAVEPTPGLAESCRNKRLETIEQTVEELNFQSAFADVIASFEVIEHLSDPRQFLEIIHKFLKQGGVFIGSCPNGEGLGPLVIKQHASSIDHEHLSYFNPRSLSLLLSQVGFETLEILTPGELDVDLLYSDFLENPDLFKNQGFFQFLFSQKNDPLFRNFQRFLKENLLSSHLWIVGRKI